MKTKLYKIRKLFARENKIPMFFEAKQLIETQKAVYLYGHGTLETQRMGVCCICGRTLTHPVSVELGIGPECGNHFHDWDRIGGYNKENLERLRGAVMEIKVDQWIPKSIIADSKETSTKITIPFDHKMLKKYADPKKLVPPPRRVFMKDAQTMEVYFPYNIKDLEIVRGLEGRKFDPVRKIWTAPFNIDAACLLQDKGFDFDETTKVLLQRPEKKEVPKDIPGIRSGMYGFQMKGVEFIEKHYGRAFVGDEMGLGKTIQAIAWCELHPDKRPVIIVVPSVVKLNWQIEINHWTGRNSVEILSGTTPYKLHTANYFIINYDILHYWIDALKRINPKIIITDEAHYYKNNQANRTKALKKLAKGIDHFIALSGTPIVNRPAEIYNAVKIIAPNLFANEWQFKQRYCGARHNGFGWDFSGSSNTQELHEKLTESIMIRRLKKDVLKELPAKTRSYVPIPIDNGQEYHSAEANFKQYIKATKGADAADKASGAEMLVKIETLKQLAVRGKMINIVKWVDDFLESDNKLVIFAVHKFVIDTIMEVFKNRAVKIDGSVSGQARQDAITAFQNHDNVRLFVGNIKAAGVGITLTAASHVAIIELPWTPGDLDQAEDRCHRIGQEDAVNIHYLLANNTIEEKIARLIDKKRKVLDSVLDGKDTESESLLMELLNQYE